jgi:hypothetical protein
MDKGRRVFITYEPRAFTDGISHWLDSSLNDFAKMNKSYIRLLVYDSQTTSSDCEERVIPFWIVLLGEVLRIARRCQCGLQ